MDQSPPERENPYASLMIPVEDRQSAASPSPNKPNEPLVEPIRTSGALSLADYYYGVRLGRRRLRRFALLIFFVAPLLYLFWALNPRITFDNLGMVILIYLIAISLGGIGILIIQWLRNGRVRKIYAAGKGVFAHTESVMYENHYETRQEVMVAKVMWSMFCKFRYSDRLVVMYYDGNPFVFGIIPRSKFQTQHDWECFIGLLDRKMPRC
jgi:hypothetical protein